MSAPGGSAIRLFITPWSRGYCEVRIEAWDGRVSGIGQAALSKTSPSRASASMFAVCAEASP